MLKKLKIAISGNSDIYLQDSLKSNFEIVELPTSISYGIDTEVNYDFLFIFDGDVNMQYENYFIPLSQIKDIPVIGIRRLSKLLQFEYLKFFDIKTPDTYFINNIRNNTINGWSLLDILKNVPDENKIVLKMDKGARGIGQMLCTKKELIQLYHSSINFFDLNNSLSVKDSTSLAYVKDKDNDDMDDENYGKSLYKNTKEKNKLKIVPFEKELIKNIRTGNEGWSRYLTGTLQDGKDLLIQDYEKVIKEYRYLFFFNEEPIIIERKIGDDENWQANSCQTGFGKQVSLIESGIPESLVQKINELCYYLKVPFLSIDVYQNEDNEWGIFEFQAEFGIQFVPYQELHTKLNKSVENLYYNLKK